MDLISLGEEGSLLAQAISMYPAVRYQSWALMQRWKMALCHLFEIELVPRLVDGNMMPSIDIHG